MPALQFGRALSGAETRPSTGWLPGQRAASIRPRPLRRGDYTTLGSIRRYIEASIRPRPLRRGDIAVARGRSRSGSFNSAAPSQARRRRPEGESGGVRRASIRPRPLRRGDSDPRWQGTFDEGELQFGRALSGAETQADRHLRVGDARGFNSAAPSQARRPDWPGRRPRTAGLCFNSAAPSQARRQRGVRVRSHDLVASIRPRPLRRGDTRSAAQAPRGVYSFNSAAPSQARRRERR